MGVVSRQGRWAGVLVAAAAVVLAAPSPASAQAQPNPDLGAIVLSQPPGYQIAPPGIGMQGPLLADQLAGTPFEDARELAEVGPTFVRTLDGPGLRTLFILAVDAGSPQVARPFLSGAIEGAKGAGSATPLPGHEGGVRIVPSPAEADGQSIQLAVFRSGRLVFIIALLDSLAKPVTDADILAIVSAQSAAVPADVARSGPTPDEVQVIGGILARQAAARESAAESEKDAGRALSYAVAITLQAAVAVLLIVVLATRRRPASTAGTATTARVAPAPGWGPPPPTWGSPAMAPTPAWTPAPAPPAPPAWPPPG